MPASSLLETVLMAENENAISQARSVKQCSLAAKAEAAHFHGPGENHLVLFLVLPAGRRGPGVAPTETKGVCCFRMSQTSGSKRSLSNTPGRGGSMCSLI